MHHLCIGTYGSSKMVPHPIQLGFSWICCVTFFRGQLISQFRDIIWHSPSPDLMGADFLLWGTLKVHVTWHVQQQLRNWRQEFKKRLLLFHIHNFIWSILVNKNWGIKQSPSAQPHVNGKHTYDGVLPSAPKGSLATLSPLQCHAASRTMPHTLALVDHSPVCHPRTLTPLQQGCLGLDYGGKRQGWISTQFITQLIIELWRTYNMESNEKFHEPLSSSFHWHVNKKKY
jgi:hypothetical protein